MLLTKYGLVQGLNHFNWDELTPAELKEIVDQVMPILQNKLVDLQRTKEEWKTWARNSVQAELQKKEDMLKRSPITLNEIEQVHFLKFCAEHSECLKDKPYDFWLRHYYIGTIDDGYEVMCPECNEIMDLTFTKKEW